MVVLTGGHVITTRNHPHNPLSFLFQAYIDHDVKNTVLPARNVRSTNVREGYSALEVSLDLMTMMTAILEDVAAAAARDMENDAKNEADRAPGQGRTRGGRSRDHGQAPGQGQVRGEGRCVSAIVSGHRSKIIGQ